MGRVQLPPTLPSFCLGPSPGRCQGSFMSRAAQGAGYGFPLPRRPQELFPGTTSWLTLAGLPREGSWLGIPRLHQPGVRPRGLPLHPLVLPAGVKGGSCSMYEPLAVSSFVHSPFPPPPTSPEAFPVACLSTELRWAGVAGHDRQTCHRLGRCQLGAQHEEPWAGLPHAPLGPSPWHQAQQRAQGCTLS